MMQEEGINLICCLVRGLMLQIIQKDCQEGEQMLSPESLWWACVRVSDCLKQRKNVLQASSLMCGSMEYSYIMIS